MRILAILPFLLLAGCSASPAYWHDADVMSRADPSYHTSSGPCFFRGATYDVILLPKFVDGVPRATTFQLRGQDGTVKDEAAAMQCVGFHTAVAGVYEVVAKGSAGDCTWSGLRTYHFDQPRQTFVDGLDLATSCHA